jgi:DNA-binding transcriptional ArsR family regulator
VAVLERAGLVCKRKRGREQLVTGNIDAVRRAQRLLDQLEAVWRHRIDRMADILAEPAARPAARPAAEPTHGGPTP